MGDDVYVKLPQYAVDDLAAGGREWYDTVHEACMEALADPQQHLEDGPKLRFETVESTRPPVVEPSGSGGGGLAAVLREVKNLADEWLNEEGLVRSLEMDSSELIDLLYAYRDLAANPHPAPHATVSKLETDRAVELLTDLTDSWEAHLRDTEPEALNRHDDAHIAARSFLSEQEGGQDG